MGGSCESVRERFSASRAAKAQERLRGLLILEGSVEPRLVAGLDVAYKRTANGEVGLGVAVILEWGSWEQVACKVAVAPVCVPYIPGLLAFREMQVLAPALLAALREAEPDLVVVDGHGIAHPRGLGIASHVGVAFRKPSVGVAKKRLVGREVARGGRVYLEHEGRIVGVVLARGRGKLYVSPGHMVGVEEAAALVEEMLVPGRKLPVPTAVADEVSKRARTLLRPRDSLAVLDCPSGLTAL